MHAPRVTVRQKLAELVRRAPSLSAAQLSAKTGVSSVHVHQILDGLGYVYQYGRWVKIKRGH